TLKIFRVVVAYREGICDLGSTLKEEIVIWPSMVLFTPPRGQAERPPRRQLRPTPTFRTPTPFTTSAQQIARPFSNSSCRRRFSPPASSLRLFGRWWRRCRPPCNPKRFLSDSR